jgi:hypothetical protein
VANPQKNSFNAPAYIGIGGWTFEPWRGMFYPEKLTQAKELSYAASKLTSIEINGTYYGSQKTGEFSQMGARGARRDCVFAERSALRHRPAQIFTTSGDKTFSFRG